MSNRMRLGKFRFYFTLLYMAVDSYLCMVMIVPDASMVRAR